MKQIIIKSSCNYTLKTYIAFINLLFKQLNIKYTTFFLPVTERKITLLKSPHVNKKAKEQFKVSTYKAVLSLNTTDALLCINNFSSFILNKPKSISIKIKS